MRAAAPAGGLVAHETIARRFNGPPESANGGYACGVVARHVPGPATVTLRMPPPLERPLEIVGDGEGGVRMVDGEAVVAEGRPAKAPRFVPPVTASLAEAAEARAHHPGRGVRHLLSDCFVCGPERTDGLGLSPGPLAAAPDVGAAPFVAGEDLPSAGGVLAPELVWAALDCPSYAPYLWQQRKLCLLGRLTVARHREVRIGERLVALGWPLESEGRKHRTASALIEPEGAVVARAEAVWIELRP